MEPDKKPKPEVGAVIPEIELQPRLVGGGDGAVGGAENELHLACCGRTRGGLQGDVADPADPGGGRVWAGRVGSGKAEVQNAGAGHLGRRPVRAGAAADHHGDRLRNGLGWPGREDGKLDPVDALPFLGTAEG